MSSKGMVTIIGAGIGGLCCGIRLLHAGYKVLILEKTQCCGGVAKTTYLPNCPLPFDSFASILIHPNEYRKVFEDVGLSYQDYYEEIPLTPLYRFFYKDGSQFTLTKDYLNDPQAFEKAFPHSLDAYTKYVDHMYLRYKEVETDFLTQPFVYAKDILKPSVLMRALSLYPFIPATPYINHFIKNDKLRDLLTFQTFYMGFPPQKTPYLYATIPAVTQTLGLIHIKGGMGAYIKALEKAFNDLGGQILYKHPVQKILTKNNRAYGVLYKNKKIVSDLIVSNADYGHTMTQLLSFPHSYLKQKKFCSKLMMSCSVFLLRLVLSTPLPMLSTHNIFIDNHLNRELKATAKKHLPVTPPIYFYYPAAIDDNFKTDQMVTMNIMVRVPHLGSPITWNAQTICSMRQLCLKGLSHITGIDDISPLIVNENISTPLELKQEFNCSYGAAFGLAPTLFQSMMFRPQPVLKSISHLYFVGSSIHPGNGVSIVMKGAELTTKEILKRS